MMPSFRRPRLSMMPTRHTVPRPEGWQPRKIWNFNSPDEPSLTELMSDPIFGRLLASDGVPQEHVETLINEMRYKLAHL